MKMKKPKEVKPTIEELTFILEIVNNRSDEVKTFSEEWHKLVDVANMIYAYREYLQDMESYEKYLSKRRTEKHLKEQAEVV